MLLDLGAERSGAGDVPCRRQAVRVETDRFLHGRAATVILVVVIDRRAVALNIRVQMANILVAEYDAVALHFGGGRSGDCRGESGQCRAGQELHHRNE